MDDVASLIQVDTLLTRAGEGSLAAVVFLEKRECVAASYYASSLVLKEGRRIALEDRDVVAESFEGDTCCEAAQATADLGM